MTIVSLPQDVLFMKAPIGFAMSNRRKIDDLCQHISETGLLNPLVVIRQNNRFVIADGKKRFEAIKKMMRLKTLPRALNKVPCIISNSGQMPAGSETSPLLLSEQDLVHGILQGSKSGMSIKEVCHRFACSPETVGKALSIQTLHAKLKLAFTNDTISLDQAAAFATLPNPGSQWDLLIQLGPFATDDDIITAIAEGQTVIELSSGDILILPSRARKPEPVHADELYGQMDIAA